MKQYTMGGETYIAFNELIYKLGEAVTDLDDLREGQKYLHDDTVGVFNIPESYMSFDAVFSPMNSDNKRHYEDSDGRLGDDFDRAVVLSRIPSDGEVPCPNCGVPRTPDDDDDDATLGDDEDFGDKFTCYMCGRGTQKGPYEERED